MELKEAKFRQWLSDQWPKHSQQTNIESSTKNGIPDCYVQVPGCVGFWLELKVNEKSSMPLLRPEQRIWGLKHQRAEGRAWIVLLTEDIGACYIFRHPVKDVSMSGKYLKVHDTPIHICHKSQLVEWLVSNTKQ